ncbi:MAG: hypothetical protein H0U95_05250 [Bacteroidetes bacterium]|nr:hypothetical protein [Bacteroidota bacterium]
MKNVAIAILIMLGMNTLVAQTTERKESKIIITKGPKKLVAKFSCEYPDVQPSWRSDGVNYEASYMDKNKLKHVIVYDKDGNLIRKESELDYKEYPISINKYYSQRFPEEKFRILQSETASGQKYYFAKRKNNILKFDTAGNFLPDKTEKIRISEINNNQDTNKLRSNIIFFNTKALF